MFEIANNLLLAGLSNDFFAELDTGQRTGILIVAIGCATGAVIAMATIIQSAANSIHRRRSEFDLKREMIERGMSADEIAKVIECATPPEGATDRWIASWGDKKKPG